MNIIHIQYNFIYIIIIEEFNFNMGKHQLFKEIPPIELVLKVVQCFGFENLKIKVVYVKIFYKYECY